MIKEIVDIGIVELSIGLSSLLIPIFFFYYYRIKLIKEIIIAVVRMVIQLSLVAAYLEYIFELNNPALNLLWGLIMVFFSASTIIKRSNLNIKIFIFPLFLSVGISLALIDAFFLGLVVKLDNVFDARYFIPISGMILGNSINYNIIGLNHYFSNLKENNNLFQFIYINSGSKNLAIRPFIVEAITKAMNPIIATTSIIGLVSLPGMMTGQILGGSSPIEAIKYQIMVILAILIASCLSLMLCVLIINMVIFDRYGNLKENLLKQ